MLQNLIFMFSVYPKNSRTGSRKTSITQELLVIENCPTLCWVTLLIFCRLVFDISSHSTDLILAWCTSLQVSHPNSKVSHQNSRLVYEIFQFLKQAVSRTWHADSDLVIIIRTEKKERVQSCMYFLKQLVFQGVQKLTFRMGWSKHNKLSIPTSMNLYIQHVFIWFLVDT